MKTNLTYSLRSGRLLPAFATALAGIFAVSGVFGTTSFTNNDPNDNFWTTEGNWTDGVPGTDNDENRQVALNLGAGEALINSSVPNVELVGIGVGNDDGALRMVAGGSLTLFGSGADGRFEVGGAAGNQNASFVMEGGSVTAASGDLWMLGRTAGDTGTSTVTIEGGTFSTRGLSMGREATSSGTATLNITGGLLELTGAAGRNMWLNGVGASGVDSTVNISGGQMTVGNNAVIGDGGQTGHSIVNVTGTGVFDLTNHFSLGTASGRTGGTGEAALLVSDEASVTIGGRLDVGHALAADSTVTVEGGSLTVGQNINLSNKDGNNTGSETASSYLFLNGGETDALGVWIGSSDNTGDGNIVVSGDASFTVGANGLVLWGGGANSFTVDGSGATINLAQATFTSGSGFVNLIADDGGFSLVDIAGAFNINGNVLNVDASEVGLGYYALFGYESRTGTFTEGTISLADDSWIAVLHHGTFNPNEIGLEIIPEPGTYAIIFGALALAGAIVLRRRRTA